jgi:hypothetical protein
MAHAQAVAAAQSSPAGTWIVSLVMMIGIAAFVLYMLWSNGVF